MLSAFLFNIAQKPLFPIIEWIAGTLLYRFFRIGRAERLCAGKPFLSGSAKGNVFALFDFIPHFLQAAQQFVKIFHLGNESSENLKAMRKAKGYTQEELAIKLNVTRQTISKWEKGLSVPDVDFLFKIADVLETNVGTLLGGAIMDEVNKDTVAEQLAKISEQLAIKNRRSKRIWKIVGIVLLTILALNLLLAIFGMSAYTSFSTDGKTTVIEMNEDSVSYEE